MDKYTIGIDFGSESGRAVLVNAKSGEELASAVYEYPHGVMDKQLPDGTPLGVDWALQHPQDYLNVLYTTIPAVMKQADVDASNIIGIGTDFTACTMLPVTKDGMPLCFLEEYKNRPHAYVKMWKHHAAQYAANELNALAEERKEPWLANYGGKISSEWAIPKLMQILDEDPEIFEQCDRWIEAADWIVWQLTGRESRNSCTAGYKAIYNAKSGYPSSDFFRRLRPELEHVVADKLGTDIVSLGNRAGFLDSKLAMKLGLRSDCAVAVGNVDAHVCVPAAGIDGTGKMLAIIGTSTCHIMMGNDERQIPGMCGVVKDGVMPDFYGYEAGQSCVGDHFAWFMKNALPVQYQIQAEEQGMDIHTFMAQKATQLAPGESGLLALDWWNGNRSILVDVDLEGMLLGMTLQTRAEEIYRALIEATAYGTRMIIENYREHGLPVHEFYASGGISQKNALMMQIYADVLNMPVHIVASKQAPALGSAIFASVAAGQDQGGYDDVYTAASHMGRVMDHVYQPDASAVAIYDKLFSEYRILHDYFGRGENDIMKRLKAMKRDILRRK